MISINSKSIIFHVLEGALKKYVVATAIPVRNQFLVIAIATFSPLTLTLLDVYNKLYKREWELGETQPNKNIKIEQTVINCPALWDEKMYMTGANHRIYQ